VEGGITVDAERLRYPDPVLRVKDTMDMHAVAGGYGYVVFSLQDGRPLSHETFPSRGHARKEAEKKTQDALLILEIQPDGMTYREAEAVLKYERTLWSAGCRTPDTLETEENSGLLSMPHQKWDRQRMLQQLKTGKPLPGGPHENLPNGLVPAAYQRGN
jgi:hypothetical protein